MRSVRGVLAVSCGYAAAVIGAGFASGQEIVSFFARYGRAGMVGIITACAVFALFSYAVLTVCVREGITGYGGFIDTIFKSALMRKITEFSALICAAACLCVMTACAGETGKVLFGVREVTGAAVFSVLFFLLDGRKIMDINASLGAVIIFGIIFCCFYILRFREHQTFFQNTRAAVSGLAYAGYNLISAGTVLACSAGRLKTRADTASASAASGIILFIMITLIWGVLGIYYGKINLGSLPMLTMAFRQNNVLGVFYGVMLLAGISNGFAVIDLLGERLPKRLLAVPVPLLGFCMSGAGFASLVDVLYRICGYGGAALVFIVIVKSLIRLKNKEK